MNDIPTYNFHKTKYETELLIDVVELECIKSYLSKNPLHALTYYDLTLVTKGEGFFRIDDANNHAKPMDVLFSSPHQLRAWDTQRIRSGYALIFKEEFMLSFFNDPHFLNRISYFKKNRKNCMLSLSTVQFERIHDLIQQIKHEIDAYTVKNKHILRALLYQTLMLLDRVFVEQKNLPSTTQTNVHVDKFLTLVHSDFDKNHAVKYYAEKLHLTPNYLNELIKKETTLSAKEMIQDKLITESKKQLLYSNLTIVEISERLAFESPSYFIRFFKKQVGCTPLQFRKTEKP